MYFHSVMVSVKIEIKMVTQEGVCLFISNKSVAILSHGSFELIIGSLTGGADFIQIEHLFTNCSIFADASRHHTDVDIRRRHISMP